MLTCSYCQEPCYVIKIDDCEDSYTPYVSNCCEGEVIDVCEDGYEDDIREFEMTNYELKRIWENQNND